MHDLAFMRILGHCLKIRQEAHQRFLQKRVDGNTDFHLRRLENFRQDVCRITAPNGFFRERFVVNRPVL